jgi:flavin reductase (DIM6/NTAB) family NADH-FMN oxidoreductase RutF
MDGCYFYEPAQGHGLSHDPFKAIVAPRPIGWISTMDAQGRANLAPYSFFNAVADVPPIVMFSSAGWKDSIANIEATREFVCNFACRPLAEAMNASSASVAHGIDEFALAGLAAAPSRLVAPPRVAESPAALECRLIEIVRLKDLAGTELDRWMVLGQVIGVHIDRRFLTPEGLFDMAAARPILRAGYLADYVEAGPETTFTMRRPK